MNRRFKGAPTFWKAFYRLPEPQQLAAQRAFALFKANPFDPRLRPHKIHRLSAKYGVTIYAIEIERNLRATFYLDGNTVWSVDIGAHPIYER